MVKELGFKDAVLGKRPPIPQFWGDMSSEAPRIGGWGLSKILDLGQFF